MFTLTEDQMLLTRGGESFTTGLARYLDSCPGRQEAQARIYVRFRPAGVDAELSFLALLDTGGHYFIPGPDVRDLVRDHLTGKFGDVSLMTAYGLIRGELYPHQVTLIADAGEPLVIESTMFFSDEWEAPTSFMGYTGVLDRARFAVDSQNVLFHFGPPSSWI